MRRILLFLTIGTIAFMHGGLRLSSSTGITVSLYHTVQLRLVAKLSIKPHLVT